MLTPPQWLFLGEYVMDNYQRN
jgi:hypothetical protein